MTFPVDAVYTWVDGNDLAWRQSRQERAAELDIPMTGEAIDPARFRDNDELKYSLRSLAKYAPWINQLHLISAGQKPEWLNPEKVKFVSHSDIFPEIKALPVFSTRPIEMCVHRAPGLADNFLYFNDDFMLGRPLKVSDFFCKDGKPLVWAVKHSERRLKREKNSKNPCSHRMAVLKACEAVEKKYGIEYPYRMRHFPKAMTVKTVNAMWEVFPEEVNITLNSAFRSDRDISITMLYPLYLLATGQGKIRVINGLAHLKDFLFGGLGHIGLSLGDSNMEDKLKRIKLMRPKTFCINDDTKADEKVRKRFKGFMEGLFPKPSPFERS